MIDPDNVNIPSTREEVLDEIIKVLGREYQRAVLAENQAYRAYHTHRFDKDRDTTPEGVIALHRNYNGISGLVLDLKYQLERLRSHRSRLLSESIVERDILNKIKTKKENW